MGTRPCHTGGATYLNGDMRDLRRVANLSWLARPCSGHWLGSGCRPLDGAARLAPVPDDAGVGGAALVAPGFIGHPPQALFRPPALHGFGLGVVEPGGVVGRAGAGGGQATRACRVGAQLGVSTGSSMQMLKVCRPAAGLSIASKIASARSGRPASSPRGCHLRRPSHVRTQPGPARLRPPGRAASARRTARTFRAVAGYRRRRPGPGRESPRPPGGTVLESCRIRAKSSARGSPKAPKLN